MEVKNTYTQRFLWQGETPQKWQTTHGLSFSNKESNFWMKPKPEKFQRDYFQAKQNLHGADQLHSKRQRWPEPKRSGTWSPFIQKALWQSIFVWAGCPLKRTSRPIFLLTSHMAFSLIPVQVTKATKGNGSPSPQVVSRAIKTSTMPTLVCNCPQGVAAQGSEGKATRAQAA